jgi:outer membrane protein
VQVSFRKVLMGSLIAATFAIPAAAEVKIGVVDIAKLFDESPQAKVVQEGLRAEFQPRLTQIMAQEQALKTSNEKYQKDAATMAPDQRTKAEKDLRDRLREIDRKKSELQDDSNAKRQEEMNKLQRLLFGEVREYAKAQNYDIVIAEGVLYATPAVDITSAVLASLQSRAPKPAAGAAPAPAKPPAKP